MLTSSEIVSTRSLRIDYWRHHGYLVYVGDKRLAYQYFWGFGVWYIQGKYRNSVFSYCRQKNIFSSTVAFKHIVKIPNISLYSTYISKRPHILITICRRPKTKRTQENSELNFVIHSLEVQSLVNRWIPRLPVHRRCKWRRPARVTFLSTLIPMNSTRMRISYRPPHSHRHTVGRKDRPQRGPEDVVHRVQIVLSLVAMT